MRDDYPELMVAEEDAYKLVLYFEEAEDKLSEKAGQPIHLVETQLARQIHLALGRFFDEQADRNSLFKHSDPTEAAEAFVKLIAAFLKERSLTWDELAEQLFVDPLTFSRLQVWLDE